MRKYTSDDIESIWNSVDGIKPAEAPTYLYSKIRNRLLLAPTGMRAVFQVKPLFVLSALIGCMLVNIWMLNQQSNQPSENVTGASITDFSAEYGLYDSSPN